jgi:hypothetical protein
LRIADLSEGPVVGVVVEGGEFPFVGIAGADDAAAVQGAVGERRGVREVVRAEQGLSGGDPDAAVNAGGLPERAGLRGQAGEDQGGPAIDEFDLGDFELGEALARWAERFSQFPAAEVG